MLSRDGVVGRVLISSGIRIYRFCKCLVVHIKERLVAHTMYLQVSHVPRRLVLVLFSALHNQILLATS
jgi:hypothetical protein